MVDTVNELKNFIKHIVFLSFTLVAELVFSQQQNLPLNREFNLVNQKVFNGFNNNVHTSFQPINQSFIRLDTISDLSKSEQKYYLINISKSKKKPKHFFKWVSRTMAYENFMVVDTGNFYLTVDPLFNIEIGKDTEDNSGRSLYRNTRGVIIRSNIGEIFSFETSFYENQAVLPEYLDDYSSATGIIPGQGRWKRFKTNQGYDFSSAAANVSYTPAKFINFQLGTGKHFVGDGYRSLILSDASFNYPFWKIITTFGKKDQFQYTKLNASLSSVTRREEGSTSEALFQRKTMSTHYFSWLVTKWLNVGLFESTLWQTEDSNGTLPLQWQQFNPIIGVNTITTGFEDVNHTVVGGNLKIKLPFKTILYNQFVYDGGSKYGYQVGVKFFLIPYITLQAEYNNVAKNTYQSNIPLQAYTNYNESLAHPLGNDFDELVGILNLKYKRAFFQVKGILTTENLSNSFSETAFFQYHLGFLINPKNNMSILLGSTFINDETNYLYFGLRTNLRNLYDDF